MSIFGRGVIRGTLAEVLARRGELAAAAALRDAFGFRREGLSDLREMFPDLGPRELGSLFDIAYRGLEAAAALTWGRGDDRSWIDRMPINSGILAGDTSGNRALLSADVIPAGEFLNRSMRVNILATGAESIDELRRMARDELARRLRESPRGFGISEAEANDAAGFLERGSGSVQFNFSAARN
jgi:hypothetical protein